jgi:hypothetical protein
MYSVYNLHLTDLTRCKVSKTYCKPLSNDIKEARGEEEDIVTIHSDFVLLSSMKTLINFAAKESRASPSDVDDQRAVITSCIYLIIQHSAPSNLSSFLNHRRIHCNMTPSQRLGIRLLSQVTPSASFAHAQPQVVCRRVAAASIARRHISSATQRRQDVQSPPPIPPPARAANNVERVQTELSPSSDSQPIRNLSSGLSDPPPTVVEDGTQVDWTRSFHGLSSSPFTAEQAAILQEPLKFDDIEIKPDGIIYLPEIKYRRILNRAFGPGGWGLAPRGETIVTGKVVTREYGLVCGGR